MILLNLKKLNLFGLSISFDFILISNKFCASEAEANFSLLQIKISKKFNLKPTRLFYFQQSLLLVFIDSML